MSQIQSPYVALVVLPSQIKIATATEQKMVREKKSEKIHGKLTF